MKINLINSPLSCIAKSIGFMKVIMNKKIILSLMVFGFLGACTSPTAMIGPAYTLTSSGNVLQAGLSYGSNEMITMYTGKTPLENLQQITKEEKNIKKKTLESHDFYILVKNKIEKTGNKIKISSQ